MTEHIATNVEAKVKAHEATEQQQQQEEEDDEIAEELDGFEDMDGAEDDDEAQDATTARVANYPTHLDPLTTTATIATRSTKKFSPTTKSKALRARDREIQVLNRKLHASQRMISDLRLQLHKFLANEGMLHLENRVKEKHLRIDQLVQENRMLLHQQRTLAKQIDDMQLSHESLPRKQLALHEELRMWKDKVRKLKEKDVKAEELAFRNHQHITTLLAKTKQLQEQLREAEKAGNARNSSNANSNNNTSMVASSSGSPGSTRSSTIGSARANHQTAATIAAAASASTGMSNTLKTLAVVASFENSTLPDTQSIIAFQEEEIIRLQQRVALTKKAQKTERAKLERLLKQSEDNYALFTQQMETFLREMTEKEKQMRTGVLQVKTLRRTVRELALHIQANQQFHQIAMGKVNLTGMPTKLPALQVHDLVDGIISQMAPSYAHQVMAHKPKLSAIKKTSCPTNTVNRNQLAVAVAPASSSRSGHQEEPTPEHREARPALSGHHIDNMGGNKSSVGSGSEQLMVPCRPPPTEPIKRPPRRIYTKSEEQERKTDEKAPSNVVDEDLHSNQLLSLEPPATTQQVSNPPSVDADAEASQEQEEVQEEEEDEEEGKVHDGGNNATEDDATVDLDLIIPQQVENVIASAHGHSVTAASNSSEDESLSYSFEDFMK